MSVRPRGKYWIVDVCIGTQRVRRSARTRAEGREVEAALRREIKESAVPVHGLEDALLRWLDHELPHLKDQDGHRSKANHLRPFLEGRTFADIADVVQDIKTTMVAQGYQAATINRRLALLRRLCSLAYRSWGWISQPVGQKVTLLPERNARHVYLSPEQVEDLASRCRRAEGKAVRLLAYTGMRKGEFFALQRGEGQIVEDCIVLGIGTKSGRPRVIPVPPPARLILKQLPLPVTEQTLRTEFAKARKAAKLAHVRIHDLRHTYASWLAQENVSLTTIGDLLGHSQASTTRRYAHLSVEALRVATGRLGRKKRSRRGTKHGTRRST